MSASNTKLVSHEITGVVFADPAKPTYRVRFKTTNTNKTLDGNRLQNFVHEIIVSDENRILNDKAADTLSVRVRISGSVESQSRITAIVTQLCSQLPNWVGTESTNLGFEPVTVPVNP